LPVLARGDAVAEGDGAWFIAFYLLSGDQELIKRLDR
jgi:hypothetical protein